VHIYQTEEVRSHIIFGLFIKLSNYPGLFRTALPVDSTRHRLDHIFGRFFAYTLQVIRRELNGPWLFGSAFGGTVTPPFNASSGGIL
jgi:hypothetical protein